MIVDPNNISTHLEAGTRSEREWVIDNVPLFDAPAESLMEVYYYRWIAFRRRLSQTPAGHVVEEFPTPPVRGYANRYGAISCAAAHQIREGRWLRDSTYMTEYARYWFSTGVNPRHYSTWLAHAIERLLAVHPDPSLIEDLLQDLIFNHRQWEAVYRDPNGLFWRQDGLDGMEHQVGGSGYRPTINSYMYGDARAIAALCEFAGCSDVAQAFRHRAKALRDAIHDQLWNPDDHFFETASPETGDPVGVREQIGYIPWYFDIPADTEEYARAWNQLRDPEGFDAPYGPTTVERRDPDFAARDTCCFWDGTSWPFATSQTMVALGNLIRNYDHAPIGRPEYLDLLRTYTNTQFKTTAGGERIPWIGESVNPLTGEWTSAVKDYSHSTYADLILSGLVGLRPSLGDALRVDPLLPEDVAEEWGYFAVDNLRYHGHDLAVVYDQTGDNYEFGPGLHLLVDGDIEATADGLGPIETILPGEIGEPDVDVADVEPPGEEVEQLTVTVSQANGGNPGINAVDGSYETTWYQRADHSTHWIQLTFPEERSFHSLTITLNTPAEAYTVQYRRDGLWADVSVQDRRPEVPQIGGNVITFDAVETDRIRVLFEGGSGRFEDATDVGVKEIEWNTPFPIELE